MEHAQGGLMRGITVNGQSVEVFTRNEFSKQALKHIKNTVGSLAKASSKKIIPRNFQRHDRTPGPVHIFTKDEVMRMELDEHFKKIFESMENEATSDPSNKSKIVFGAFCQGQFLTAKEAADLINEKFPGYPITAKFVSVFIARVFNDKRKRLIHRFLQRSELGNGNRYRVYPYLCQMHLTDIFELTMLQSKVSLRDICLRVPEAERYLQMTPPSTGGAVITGPPPGSESPIEQPQGSESDSEKVDLSPENFSGEKYFDGAQGYSIPENIKLDVNVTVTFRFENK